MKKESTNYELDSKKYDELVKYLEIRSFEFELDEVKVWLSKLINIEQIKYALFTNYS